VQAQGKLGRFFSSGSAALVVVLALLVVIALVVRRRRVVFRVPARVESIRPVVARVSEVARRARLDEDAIFQCRLALDEACTNIIRHAYADDPSGEIEVVVEAGEGICTVHLIDFGEPYDPDQIPAPPIGSRVEESSPGGLGLYLMCAVMDEVRYTPGTRRNRLVMVKRAG
jgi:serine/threonine-protein kinase RsbW